MANSAICSELQDGYDLSCSRNLVKKYFQEAVIINLSDIDRTNSTINPPTALACEYNLELLLLESKTGVQFKLPESGSSIKGFVGKSKTDNGFVQYLHQVQIFVAGNSAETKCILDKLDHGRYAIALQTTDGTVEVYGYQNGISTGDYTYDLVDGGGGALITLQSDEDAQEDYLPFVYTPQVGGDANADFNSQFENTP